MGTTSRQNKNSEVETGRAVISAPAKPNNFSLRFEENNGKYRSFVCEADPPAIRRCRCGECKTGERVTIASSKSSKSPKESVTFPWKPGGVTPPLDLPVRYPLVCSLAPTSTCSTFFQAGLAKHFHRCFNGEEKKGKEKRSHRWRSGDLKKPLFSNETLR